MAGLYIHIPAPPNKAQSPVHTAAFVQALCAEMNAYAVSHGKNETIEALLIGGDVYTLSYQHIQSLTQAVFASFDGSTIQEMTINIQPGRHSLDAFQGYIALGFDRVNILAHSFFDEDLERCLASHNAHQVLLCLEDAQKAGFKRIGINLLIDIDEQPTEYWGANLEKITHLGIDHITFDTSVLSSQNVFPAQLGQTLFFPALLNEVYDRYKFGLDYLTKAGFEHYTLSSFARPEAQSCYTQLHLQHANLLGIGPEAHSFWWYGASQSRAHRWANVDNIERYNALLSQGELPVDTRSLLTLDELANEYIVLGLSASAGLNLETLETDYGVDLLMEQIDEIAWLESQDLIEPIRNNRVNLTQTGKLHAAEVTNRLLLDV